MRLLCCCLMVVCAAIGLISDSNTRTSAQETKAEGAQGLSIFDVSVSTASFNPSRGERVELRYHLSRSALVTIKVFDPDLHITRVLTEKTQKDAGVQGEVWDGKDIDGKLVPNEAYFFTIEAEDALGSQAVYDPITFSGGEPFDLGQAQFDRESGTLTYKLSQPSRVLIRIGIPGSALLKTLVDWEPRIGGEITEYWNGKDEDNVIDLWRQGNFTTMITYFTLPETSVITFGNTTYTYREYKANGSSARPKKVERPILNPRKLSPHFLTSRVNNRSFKVLLSFPEIEEKPAQTVPMIKDQVLVRVDIHEKDREVLLQQQFEIILFVDTVYFAEEERGYVPFNFPWELKQLPEGEHILTVNIVTFNDQFGVGSRKVKVVK